MVDRLPFIFHLGMYIGYVENPFLPGITHATYVPFFGPRQG